MKKKCSIPIPIELIAVVGGTLVSRYCDLPKIYDIETVGHIPTGYMYKILFFNILIFAKILVST